jgi:hypothetical protein
MAKAMAAERTSPLAMKNANGATRSRRRAVRALAIGGQDRGESWRMKGLWLMIRACFNHACNTGGLSG